MGEFTFVVEKTCPICGESTRVVKTKSKLLMERMDEDFCVHYQRFNPYFYKIWFCEKCGFAADEKTFLGTIPELHKRKIQEFLSKRKLGLEFVEERKIPEAVASFKLAIFYAELTDQPLAKRAGLYLELAWIYRDAEDEENEMEMLKRAAELYDKSLMTERYPINGMSDTMAMYLIGAIYFRMKDYEKSTQYISRIIGDQNIRNNEVQIYKRARDLWQDIRQLKGGDSEE
ncbi:DUF2225 domain-containing protein [Selenomonas ruminis]|uniref:DUF2225 domain-containing protein n=1 Tax=Selenomonas ruminis TaxID=2593411 RepID=A0A5D6WAU7_9FIRM|nr:DUF2225 domain-containing protein [Selenomonas sp. mPRGC5]TYZ24109.1 DUF2225 domain-containing protein [Selenomonas sp. mPRGC5]